MSVLLLLLSLQAYTQEIKIQSSTQLWTEVGLSGWITKKLKWQADLQYARQSPYQSLDLMRFEQQLTGRLWMHYYLRQHTRISAFAGIWGNRKINDNVNAREHNEYRAAIQVQHYRFPGRRLMFIYRLRKEFRELSELNADFKNSMRGRYMLRVHHRLGKTEHRDPLYFIFFNELFLRVIKESPSLSVFDQNRIFAGLGYEFNRWFTIEAGYFHQFQLNRARTVFDNNSILQVSLFFDQLTTYKSKQP